MMYQTPEIAAFLRELRSLSAPVPPGFYDLRISTIQEHCNGIGSDDPSTKWLVAPTTFVFAWMEVAAVPHDLWWSPIYNDGTRKHFVQSNDEFRETLDRKADRSFSWAWPLQLRNTLRDARHWQADRAHDILMSDKCWEIWQKNANTDEDPEVPA